MYFLVEHVQDIGGEEGQDIGGEEEAEPDSAEVWWRGSEGVRVLTSSV